MVFLGNMCMDTLHKGDNDDDYDNNNNNNNNFNNNNNNNNRVLAGLCRGTRRITASSS
jgi:hypothetical protein